MIFGPCDLPLFKEGFNFYEDILIIDNFVPEDDRGLQIKILRSIKPWMIKMKILIIWIHFTLNNQLGIKK
ncbi:hypothetical protein GCM10028868_00420 [Virgibacillus kimchii]